MRRSNILAYAAPGAAIKGMTLPLISYLPPVYAALSGFSLATVGVVFMIARLWDIVIDPVVGAVMDRYSPPFGRRKFWIAISTPVLMISLWFLFKPPPDATLPWLVALLILLYVAWTILTFSHAAWPADLATDRESRTRLIAWREWAGVIGMVVVLATPIIVAGQKASLPAQLSVMGSALVLMLPFTVLPGLFMLPASGSAPAEGSQPASLLDGWLLVRQSQPMRRLLLADLLSGCGYAANSATSYFVFSSYLAVGAHFSAIMLCFMLGMIVGVPVLMRLSIKVGPQRSFAVAMLGAAAASLAFAAVPGQAPYVAMAVNGALGFFTGGYQFNLNAEMVRLASDDRDRSGIDRTSQHFALLAMTNKLGYAIAIGVVYVLLDFLVGDAGSLSDLPEPTLIAFGLILPATLFVLAATAFQLTSAKPKQG